MGKAKRLNLTSGVLDSLVVTAENRIKSLEEIKEDIEGELWSARTTLKVLKRLVPVSAGRSVDSDTKN